MLINQTGTFRSKLLVNHIQQPPQSLVVSFNVNREHQLYYKNLKVEHCGTLGFTVVDFHLEATLPQFLKIAFGVGCALRVTIHFDVQKLIIKFDIVFVRFVSRHSRLHTCVFDSCGLSQPSHEICTSSFSNLCLAVVLYTLALWNC